MAKAPSSFAQVARGYKNLWDSSTLVRKADATKAASRILANLDRYSEASRATGVPKWAIGILHYRESNLNFNTYLGNGQSLSQRTTIVPKGRGPFKSFTEGAIDALKVEGFDKVKDWSAARFLYLSEKYNGFGYFMRGINSPYVWGGTNKQQRGKFIRDGVFDRSVMDTQLGSAAILKALCELSPEINAQVNKAPVVTPSPAPAPVIPPSTDILTKIEASGKTAGQYAQERDAMPTPPTVVVEEKSPVESKIMWTQVVGLGAALGTLFGLNMDPATQAMIVTGIVGLQGLVTTGLRLFGKQTAITTGKT